MFNPLWISVEVSARKQMQSWACTKYAVKHMLGSWLVSWPRYIVNKVDVCPNTSNSKKQNEGQNT